MPAKTGRALVVEKNGVAIAGVRVNSITVNGGEVDITSFDDLGWRTFGDFVGVKSIDLSVSGIWNDTILGAVAFGNADNLLTDITFVDGGGLEREGDFYLSSYTETGNHDGALEFEATFLSSGAITAVP
jgi:predicted secreted protein